MNSQNNVSIQLKISKDKDKSFDTHMPSLLTYSHMDEKNYNKIIRRVNKVLSNTPIISTGVDRDPIVGILLGIALCAGSMVSLSMSFHSNIPPTILISVFFTFIILFILAHWFIPEQNQSSLIYRKKVIDSCIQDTNRCLLIEEIQIISIDDESILFHICPSILRSQSNPSS